MATLVALLLGCQGEPQAFAIAGTLVGVIFIGILWPAIAVKSIFGELGWKRSRCREGDTLETFVEVTNRWPWPVWGLVIESEEEVVNGGHEQRETVALACLPPLGRTRFSWQAVPLRRGEYPTKPAFLATGFPFGIWTARTPLRITQSVLVWPKTVELNNMPEIGGDERSIVGAWSDRPGFEGDIIGTRLYREGDSLRSIHWAQSAKHDRLVVSERQSVAHQMLRLSILLPPEKTTSIADPELGEWLLRIGGSIARTFLSHRWCLQMDVGPTRIHAEPCTHGIHRVLDALARHGMTTNSESSRVAHSASVDSICHSRHRSRLSVIVATRNAYHERNVRRQPKGSHQWIIVDRNGGYDREQGSNIWMEIDIDRPVWPQLNNRWDRFCGRSDPSSSSKISSS